MYEDSVQQTAGEAHALFNALCSIANDSGVVLEQDVNPTRIEIIGINERTGKRVRFIVTRTDEKQEQGG